MKGNEQKKSKKLRLIALLFAIQSLVIIMMRSNYSTHTLVKKAYLWMKYFRKLWISQFYPHSGDCVLAFK